jgi:putative ABC transport system permease protein
MPPEIQPGILDWRTVIRLAWRNLRRNRRRTWITAATVGTAVFFLQITWSMMVGIESQSYDNLINYQTGHAKLYAAGYFEIREELPLDRSLENLDVIQATVSSVDGVAATTPRLTFQAHLSDGADQIPCLGIGIELLGSDTEVFRIPQAVVDGEYLSPDEEGMLLGSGLAEMFELGVGDWLTVLAKTQAGAYEALDIPITGVIGTGNPLIDQSSFFIPLKRARDMLGMEGEATELAVRFSQIASESATLARIDRAIAEVDGLDLKGWRDAEEDFLAFAKMKRAGSVVFLAIFIVLALVGITNTILMAAYERTREIGMMMAMGTRGGGIRGLFLTEGALNGLLGGAVGSLGALAVIMYFATAGLDLQALYGDMDIGYPVKERMYFALDFVAMGVTWLLTGLLAALASLYPAARASRQDPVRALRYV